MTLSSPLNTQQLELESTTTLESQLQQRQSLAAIGQRYIESNTKRTGDFYEYYVALEAWKRKAEVFMNLGSSGKTDLILKIGDRLLECDVKVRKHNIVNGKLYYCTRGSKTFPKHIFLIYVHPVTGEIDWHKDRNPDFLEDFWK